MRTSLCLSSLSLAFTRGQKIENLYYTSFSLSLSLSSPPSLSLSLSLLPLSLSLSLPLSDEDEDADGDSDDAEEIAIRNASSLTDYLSLVLINPLPDLKPRKPKPT